MIARIKEMLSDEVPQAKKANHKKKKHEKKKPHHFSAAGKALSIQAAVEKPKRYQLLKLVDGEYRPVTLEEWQAFERDYPDQA